MSDKKIKGWYKLDNAGTLYSSIASSRVSTVFRLSVGLTKAVEPAILQEALDHVMKRFPYLNVTLRRGFFWYYYEHSDARPLIEQEAHYPCKAIRQKKGVFPFRILYYKNYVHLEMSHSVCDGGGGMAFFKPLIIEYLRLKEGVRCPPTQDIIDLDSPVDPEEFEDAFKKYNEANIRPPHKVERAYHLDFKLLDKGQYLLLTGIVPAKELVRQAKAYKCTVTQFLTAVYLESIQEYLLSLPKPRMAKSGYTKAVIAINIPVDIRSFYPTKTLRNFFVSLNPCIDLSLGIYTREEIIDQIRGYMSLYINKKNINRYISRNVRNEELLVLRVIPLWIKKLVMPIIYKRYGESSYTSSISNLGIIKMPEEVSPYIKSIEAFPPPSAGNKLKAVITSYNGNTFIGFGKTVREMDIERIFFTKLREMSIPLRLEGNQLNYYDMEGV